MTAASGRLLAPRLTNAFLSGVPPSGHSTDAPNMATRFAVTAQRPGTLPKYRLTRTSA